MTLWTTILDIPSSKNASLIDEMIFFGAKYILKWYRWANKNKFSIDWKTTAMNYILFLYPRTISRWKEMKHKPLAYNKFYYLIVSIGLKSDKTIIRRLKKFATRHELDQNFEKILNDKSAKLLTLRHYLSSI